MALLTSMRCASRAFQVKEFEPKLLRALGRDSSVGIETRYALDAPRIESRRGEIFRNRPDRPWSLPRLLYNGYRVSFPGFKRPGCGVNHPPSFSAEVKERVELYLYSPSGPYERDNANNRCSSVSVVNRPKAGRQTF